MIVLLALACTPDPPLGPPSPASWVDDPGPVGAEVLGAVGNGSAMVRVRAFNAFGGSVFGPDATVAVDGSDMSVDIGPLGYGELELTEPGTYELELGSSSETAYVYGGDWPGFGLMRGFRAPVETRQDAISAGNGVLFANENEVWFTGIDMPPHRVLTADGTVGGMVAGHYDGDGVVDAAVWSGRSIHFLRGRSDGGMTYVAHLRSPTHTVSGIDFGDATNDGLPDLVIVWTGPPLQGRLDVWESDGLLGFEPSPNRSLSQIPFDVAVGDNTGEGNNQITVTIDGGNWERFFRIPKGYAPSGPAVELTLSQFTRVYSPGDVNADGSDDLLFVPPYLPQNERRVLMFDLDGDVATFTGITRTDAFVSIDDLDQDGLYDLIFSDADGTVAGVHKSRTGQGLESDTLMRGLPVGGGPIARVPGTQQFLLAGEDDWLWLDGISTPDEWLAIEDRPLETPGLTVRDGRFELRELDGDPTAPELIGIRPGPNSTRLRIWSMRYDGAVELGDVQLDPNEKVLMDLAVCGDDAYVVLEDALYRVDISNPASLSVVDTRTMAGTGVACGNGPAGPVSVLTGQEALILDSALDQVSVAPAAGAVDIWLDSLGTTTCDRVDCRVLRGPVGPNGAVVRVEGWPQGAEIDGELVYGSGYPTIADVDGNGHADVLFHRNGKIVLYRHTGETLGPPEIWHTRRGLSGPLAIADYDGDGFNDAWGVEPANLRLRITGSPTVPFVPLPDTGDTGASDTATGTGDTGVN